jgi:hypothetical protein
MRTKHLLLLLIFSAPACSDWELPQSFPVILTEEVAQVDAGGADFTAHVLSLGTDQPAQRYGFVWSDAQMPTLGSSQLALSDDLQKGTFTRRIRSDLIEGTRYFVRAFVQTAELTIYGNEVSFISMGSLAPVISGFTPTSGFEGTEITVRGSHFSGGLQGNIVRIGSKTCPVLEATDSVLKILLPLTPDYQLGEVGDFRISVTTAGRTATSDADFSILGPRFRSLSKTSGRVGDLLSLYGEYFGMAEYLAVHFIAPGDVERSTQAYIMSPQLVECYVPDMANNTAELSLKYYLGNRRMQFDSGQSFEVINSWTKISDTTPLGDLSGLCTAVIGNAIYVMGGPTPYKYSTSDMVWTSLAGFPGIARYYGTAFAMGGKIYYGFGTDFSRAFSDLWRYDPVQDQWEFVMETPLDARTRPQSAVVGDAVYIGFGSATDLWQYTPSGNQWVQVPVPIELQEPAYATHFTAGNKIYYIGLQHPGDWVNPRADCWEFDPAVQSWTRRSDFPDRIYGEPATVREDRGLVISSNITASYNRVYEYDVPGDRWIQRQTLAGGTGYFQLGAAVNGRLYLASGNLWEMSFD